jgi:hypothetical protein
MSQESKPEQRRDRAANVDQADIERMMQDKRKRDEAIKRKAAKQGKRNR